MFTRMARNYEGRTAIVIGAGGIGGAIVQLLMGQVGRLMVADRDAALLENLVARNPVGSVGIRRLDVGNSIDVAECFAEWDAAGVIPDFLFYAAGVLNIEPFAQTTAESWERSVNINLNGAFYCVQEAARRMRSRGCGSIIVLGSIAGTKSRSGARVSPVYNATKAGLAAFVNSTAMQLRPDGVRINCISPGPTDTAMMGLQPAQVHAAVNEMTLDGRMNQPQEIAEVALFVAAHGRFTGEEIAIGGGAGLGG